jgi:hypothetical protein
MRGESSPTRSFGSGQREIGGGSRFLVSALAGILATARHCIFTGRSGPSSSQVRRRWILRPACNVSQGERNEVTDLKLILSGDSTEEKQASALKR